MSSIEINPQFEQVLNFVNRTNQAIFLTGKAGTGKTTLLKYIREKTFKQIAIVAPTGVAAINAGGSTIHSFFQFPFTPFLPSLKDSGETDYSKNNLPTLKYNSQRLAIFRSLELLVIDEISMVRADLLDQIDATLKFTRKKTHLPFGGVQVLLIGDMYQLPPVIQSEEWKMLSAVYRSPYFFESLVMRANPPVYIELEKIYRQSDDVFIQLLNKVRNNIMDAQSLELLNSHYKPNLSEKDYHENITLTTHNRKADEINLKNLNSLPGKEFKYKAKVEGSFSEKNYPSDETLTLKIGTRVMFLKNNNEKNYYNGKIGKVTYLDQDKIKVKCEEDKGEIEVGRETWTNVSYKLDKNTKHIDEEILGTFNHFPLRLAWAITIHKSQGLTFDRLIIDAAESFTAGQVYVALSRCRNLEGLILSTKINTQSLLNDRNILQFSASKHDNEQVNTIFSNAQKNYTRSLLFELFDLTEVAQLRNELAGVLQMYRSRVAAAGHNWFGTFSNRIDLLKEVSEKFKRQLSALTESSHNYEADTNLQTRLKQAATYFDGELRKCIEFLKECAIVTESKEAATALNEFLQSIYELLYIQQSHLTAISGGFIFSDFVQHKLKLKVPEYKINVYSNAANTKVNVDLPHPALYRSLLLKRDEIANDDRQPIFIIAKNKGLEDICHYLPVTHDDLMQMSGFGPSKVEQYGDDFLQIVKKYMSEHGLESQMHLKKTKKVKKSKKTAASDYSVPDESVYGTDSDKPQKKANTREQTFNLFREGFGLEEIARQRGVTLSTVQTHLIPYLSSGEIKITELMDEKKYRSIIDALEDFKFEQGIGSVKNKLGEAFSFAEIRWVLALKIGNS